MWTCKIQNQAFIQLGKMNTNIYFNITVLSEESIFAKASDLKN